MVTAEDSYVSHASGLLSAHSGGGQKHSVIDLGIAGAAAEVAADGEADLVARRVGGSS